METISQKYAIQVLCLVGALQPVRYATIEDTLGTISSSTLKSARRAHRGWPPSRQRYAEIPPRVAYGMTSDGEELCGLLEPLLKWAADRP